MTVEQAYVVLGIADQEIDERHLKKIYLERIRLAHPDSNPEDENARYRFEMIKEAYEMLLEFRRHPERFSEEMIGKPADGAGEDPWDRYNKADQRYAEARHDEARRRAEDEIRRRNMREHREERAKEAVKRQAERGKRAEEAAKRQAESGKRAEEAEKRAAENRQHEEEQAGKREADSRRYAFARGLAYLQSKWEENRYLPYLPDFLLFSLLSVITIAYWAILPVRGDSTISLYTANARYLFAGAFVFLAAAQVVKAIQHFWTNQIFTVLAYLVTVELLIGVLKMLVSFLNRPDDGLLALLSMLLLAGYEGMHVRQIRLDIGSHKGNERFLARMISTEFFVSFGTGLLALGLGHFL